MGYQELTVYLWHVLDKLYADEKVAESATVLDIGGDWCHWDWFFKNHHVKKFDIINLYEKPFYNAPARIFPLDAHNLEAFPSESYNLALSLETLEHLYNPVKAVDEMTRLLKVGGIIFLSGMCAYGYHAEPQCYWHVYPDAMSYMLRNFDIAEIIGYGGSEKDPMGVWAWGTKQAWTESSEPPTSFEAQPFYRHIPNPSALENFLAEEGYVYQQGIERLRDKEGRLIGMSPDLHE